MEVRELEMVSTDRRVSPRDLDVGNDGKLLREGFDIFNLVRDELECMV